jgi:serine/threonine-protein kinase TTK/MPS1
MGIILHQWMYDGVSPFACVAGGRLAKIAAITNPDYPVELDPLPDPLVIETLKLCLEKDPAKRASADELLQHPFLRPIFPKSDG